MYGFKEIKKLYLFIVELLGSRDRDRVAQDGGVLSVPVVGLHAQETLWHHADPGDGAQTLSGCGRPHSSG